MTDENKSKRNSTLGVAPPRPSSSGGVATADPDSPMPPKPVMPGRRPSSTSATPPSMRPANRAPERSGAYPDLGTADAQVPPANVGAAAKESVTIHTFEDLLADLDLLSPNREGPTAPPEPVHLGGSASAKVATDVPPKSKPHTVRGMRIPLALPVQVRGKLESPKAFDETTRTIIVMARGAVLTLAARVSVGEVLTVVNPTNKKEALCEVVDIQGGSSGKNQVEVEFMQPAHEFWPINFPTDEFDSARLSPAPDTARPAQAVQPPMQQKAPPTPAKPSLVPSHLLVTGYSTPTVVPPPAKALETAAPVTPYRSVPPAAPAVLTHPASSEIIDLSTLVFADEPKNVEARSSTSAPAPATQELAWPVAPSAPSELPIELPTTKADRAITDIRLVSETKRGKNWMLIGFGAAAVVALTAGGMFLYRAGHAKGAASATAQPAVTAPSASVGPLTPTTNAQPIAPAPQPNGGSNAQSKPGSPAPANSALQTNTKPPAKDAAVNQPLKPTPANVSAANSGKPKLPSNLTSAIVPVPRRSASNSDPIAAPSIGNGAPNMAAMGGIVPGTNLGSPSQSQLQAPLPVGGHVQAPRLVSSTSPSYPALARRSRVEGDVVVDTTIDATGKVTGMKIISGPAMLQDAARDALRQWRYSPGTLNGQAIPTQMQVTIKFRLN